MIPACMGGWCGLRNRCERHLTADREVVAERLCDRGDEMPQPVLERPEQQQADVVE